jgi:hypothetical protein
MTKPPDQQTPPPPPRPGIPAGSTDKTENRQRTRGWQEADKLAWDDHEEYFENQTLIEPAVKPDSYPFFYILRRPDIPGWGAVGAGDA